MVVVLVVCVVEGFQGSECCLKNKDHLQSMCRTVPYLHGVHKDSLKTLLLIWRPCKNGYRHHIVGNFE